MSQVGNLRVDLTAKGCLRVRQNTPHATFFEAWLTKSEARQLAALILKLADEGEEDLLV